MKNNVGLGLLIGFVLFLCMFLFLFSNLFLSVVFILFFVWFFWKQNGCKFVSEDQKKRFSDKGYKKHRYTTADRSHRGYGGVTRDTIRPDEDAFSGPSEPGSGNIVYPDDVKPGCVRVNGEDVPLEALHIKNPFE